MNERIQKLANELLELCGDNNIPMMLFIKSGSTSDSYTMNINGDGKQLANMVASACVENDNLLFLMNAAAIAASKTLSHGQ